MSTAYAEDFDTGEIEIPAGEQTVNIPPFIIQGPAFRRPDATGDIPVVDWHDTGIGILVPISPAPFLGAVGPRHAYVRPAPSRRGRGRHRYPSLLVRFGRWMVGAW